ncbi:type I phosphomannose isomerase catalytic subunit [Fructilactobacillus lindneri]|uniref:Mannose-6-phosphate isomerase n=1 Tax=Fructilactobacillus lindneri DSM 20690 = JCM 11027 TaxID=1122148 RepID=A0A0R2JV56_9LACO|nr:type I phosphomannose isomerase catalytic subunit [Fructilactobacillus lindneri]KRN78244.1 mannose-6-phosphate isomerase [Fructilactobacillus lindneri DSM 20690 = JCM 11027]POH05860.1 mannose-6-phosphate isomerase [Fructilactobacillus lindneri]POH23584.1 mannose-6-phosphate isomerase [Fructilactobacillus lindneri DSM 20690 = JCM 11027]SJZ95247.1 mannose-6-phosphate isomerase, type 1 [Fructilactobacillus lindneri DSM 20690 = JCM 11027]
MSAENKNEPLFLKPILHQKMWGGTNLKESNLPIKTDHVGEAWLASVYGQDLSKISNGKFKGKTLKQVWHDEPELFDNHRSNQTFPLLVKMLDAKENLSIQVHPNDENANKYFSEPNGKTECWYILAAKPDSVAYYGHNAQTAAEMKSAIQQHQLEKILTTISVKPGDLIYVPAGTLHALGAGIVALEVEQSSDNTLRFYDFDRVDPETGEQRPLNIKDAIAVTNFPNIVPSQDMTNPIQDTHNQAITSILRSKYFTLKRINVDGETNITSHHYSINVVISGSGTLSDDKQEYQIKKGDTFIMPTPITNYQFNGKLTLIQVTE